MSQDFKWVDDFVVNGKRLGDMVHLTRVLVYRRWEELERGKELNRLMNVCEVHSATLVF